MLIDNSVNMEHQISRSKPAPKKVKLAKVRSKPNGDPLGDMGRRCEVTWDDFKFVLYYDVTSGEMYELEFYVEVYQIKRGKEIYLGKFSKITPEQLVQVGKKYGKQIPLIQKISASRENKMKQRINSEFLLNIPKRICEKYNIKVPADIAMDFYNDMVNAIRGKPNVNSRKAIKNSVENDWRQVAHNLYPDVWKYWFSNVAKKANGFNRQTFDYGVQMIVKRGGRDSSNENKFFLYFTDAYYTAQREGKLNEFLDNLYEDVSNMAKYEGYKVTNSRQIKNDVQMYEIFYEYEDANGQTIKASDKVAANSEEEAKQIAVEAYRVNKGTKNTMVGDIKPYLVRPIQNSLKDATVEDVINTTTKWMTNPLGATEDTIAKGVIKTADKIRNKIKNAKEEEVGEDACVLTPFGEIDRTVANADFTDESFKAYVIEPYAEENEDMMSDGLEVK